MRPQSLAARLLAKTTKGRQLFDQLNAQAVELERLRLELSTRPESGQVADELNHLYVHLAARNEELVRMQSRVDALCLLLSTAEREVAFLAARSNSSLNGTEEPHG